jgi:hypothetical protein
MCDLNEIQNQIHTKFIIHFKLNIFMRKYFHYCYWPHTFHKNNISLKEIEISILKLGHQILGDLGAS